MNLQKYFGDRAFYRRLWRVAVPIVLQNGITNLVSLLDNIMVGRVGTEQMSGVAISNQLLFVFNLCIFGALSGAGIFGAQFFGRGNHEGVRYTFRYKLIIATVLTAAGILLLSSASKDLISLFLHESESTGDIEATLGYGVAYVKTMLLGLFPFALSQVYSSTLRECGETKWPMLAGVIAVIVNLVLNYILIFGNFGAPELGVEGAAIATVTSRFAEVAIIMARTHICAKKKYPFAVGAYRSIRLPLPLAGKITVRGLPLMLNEALWALGQTMLSQCYSTRGLDVVAATNISTTISNLFATVYFATGTSIAIIIGQLLGAGEMKEAKDTNRKLLVAGELAAIAIALVMAVVAPLFPKIYNTTDAVRTLAAELIIVASAMLPAHCFIHNCYFTLRSGGKTLITFLFDSCFVWCISVPTAFLLSSFTSVPILPLYIAVQAIELVKLVIGFILVKRGVWLNNIVAKED